MNLLEIGQNVLGQVKSIAGPVQAEVFLMDSESRVREWAEKSPENLVIAQGRGLGLRLIRDGCLGFGYTNRWAKAAVEALMQLATAASASTAPDPLADEA